MATNQTEHYGLCQWLAEDKVERVDFNADNEKIDAAIYALSTSKANSATVTALSNTVAKKAEQSNLAAVEAAVAAKAEQSDLAALTTKVSAKAEQSALTSLSSTVTTNAAKHTSDMNALRSENCWVKVAAQTLSADATSLNISIPSAHRGIYRELVLYCVLSGSSNDGIFLTVNHLTTADSYIGPNSYSGALLELTPNASVDASTTVHLTSFGTRGCLCVNADTLFNRSSLYFESICKGIVPDVTLATLSSIQIGDPGNLKAGSSVILYGLKA